MTASTRLKPKPRQLPPKGTSNRTTSPRPDPQPTPQPTTESLWVEKPLSDKEKLGMKLLLTVGAISGAILISSVLIGVWYMAML